MKKRILSILMTICLLGSITTNFVYSAESISLNVIESVDVESGGEDTEADSDLNVQTEAEEEAEIEATEAVVEVNTSEEPEEIHSEMSFEEKMKNFDVEKWLEKNREINERFNRIKEKWFQNSNQQEVVGYSLNTTADADSNTDTTNTIFFNGDGIGQGINVEANPIKGNINIEPGRYMYEFSGGGYAGGTDIVLFPNGEGEPIIKLDTSDGSIEEFKSEDIEKDTLQIDENGDKIYEYFPARYFGGIVTEDGDVYLNPVYDYGDIGYLNIYTYMDPSIYEDVIPKYCYEKRCSALAYNGNEKDAAYRIIAVPTDFAAPVRAAYNSRNDILYICDNQVIAQYDNNDYNISNIAGENFQNIESYYENGDDWFTGIFITTDNKVILTPCKANHVIVYDIEANTYKAIEIPEEVQGLEYKYDGGAYDGRYIWMAPKNAEKLLRFDTETEFMRTYDLTKYGVSANGYCGGVFDGENVWLVPDTADSLVKISISDETEPTKLEYKLNIRCNNQGTIENIANVKVIVESEDFKDVYYTDANGVINTWEYEKNSLVTITIEDEDFENYTVQRTLGEDTDIDVTLASDITVIVRDESNQLIADAYVYCNGVYENTNEIGEIKFFTSIGEEGIFVGKYGYVTEKIESSEIETGTIDVTLKKSENKIGPASECISSGNNHTLILNSDGTVSAYGDNSYGQLGTGDNVSSNIPVTVTGLSDIVKVIADENYSLAVDKNGSLYGWGQNNYGQLGQNDTDDKNKPKQIWAGSVAEIEAEGNHVILLSKSGKVYSWGINAKGQVGKGLISTYENNPLKIEGLSNIVDISAGANFSAALSVDGKLYTWGDNTCGQLCKTGITLSNKPVLADIDNVKSMSAGKTHTVAVKTDGTVWCFGDNSSAQCGSLTDTYTTQAVQVDVEGLSDIHCVISGNDYIYAEKNDGSVVRWGGNTSGQLGDLSSTFDKMYLDDYTVYAIQGEMKYVWGLMSDNIAAGLTIINTPVSIKNYGNISYVTAERDGNIMVDKSGNVYSWGNNSDGNLGYSANAKQTYPKKINSLTNIVKVAKGKYHALALDSNGELWGWGSDKNGELNQSSYEKFYSPVKLNISNVVDMSAGNNFSVILTADGSLYTYGEDANDKLGDGVTVDSSKPYMRKISGIENVEKVECGDEFVVVLAGGDVYTWGKNDVGQLGIGTEDLTNASYTKVLEGCADISVNVNHVLALMENGEVYAWGAGTVGQLGQDNKENSNVPIKVQNLPSNIVSIGTGKGISLAVTKDGYLYSWGYGKDGQLGHGISKSSLLPKKVESLSEVKYATAGNSHSVVVLKDGTVKTFGDNANGQLGIYTSELIELKDVDYTLGQKMFNYTAGNTYTVVVSGKNVKRIDNLEFAITYNPNELALIDAAAQTYMYDTKTGKDREGYIEITRALEGELRFRILKEIPAGYSYSGFINSILFEALVDCESVIKLEY